MVQFTLKVNVWFTEHKLNDLLDMRSMSSSEVMKIKRLQLFCCQQEDREVREPGRPLH